MAINSDLVAEKIFNILKGTGLAVSSFNDEGIQTIDPQEATRFVVADPNILVRLDKENETIRMSVQKDTDVEKIRLLLKQLSRDYLLNFDYKLFTKRLTPRSDNIDISRKKAHIDDSVFESKCEHEFEPREPKRCIHCNKSYKDCVAEKEEDMKNIAEGFGTMSGSTKTSYQPLDNIKIVVKHKKAVNEETRGARSRNIHSIYIQRGEERFRMSENNLKAARAMARHLNMGGEVYDTVGQAITEMAAEQKKLQEFVRYVNTSNLVNEDNEQYVTLAQESISNIKTKLQKLSGAKTYAYAVETLQSNNEVEILEDDLDLENKFTEHHFDEKVANAVESIKKNLARQTAYKASIEEAIAQESFDRLRDMLSESDLVDFASPHAKLSYQVSQLGNSVTNELLKNHLYGISKKLAAGESLGQFEYGTVKSCLLSANEAKVKDPVATQTYESKYEDFLNQFDIL